MTKEQGGGRGPLLRRIAAALLITVSVVLAPAAVVGAWARTQLVDTNSFVQTFAPIAEEPAVQAFITQRTVQAIDEQIDIDGLVADLFGGLEQLDLPDRAIAALSLLETPAAAGVRTVLENTVEGIVASPQFAQLFQVALRGSHSAMIALVKSDPNSIVHIGDDGVVSISLANLVSEVKSTLVEDGSALAGLIPEIDRKITLVPIEALPQIRGTYDIVVTVAAWLPWVLLGLLALGIAVAVNRRRALVNTGLALSLAFALALTGLIVGVTVFAASVSPGLMPAAAAHAMVTQVTDAMRSTYMLLLGLSILLTIGCVLAGNDKFLSWLRSEGSSEQS